MPTQLTPQMLTAAHKAYGAGMRSDGWSPGVGVEAAVRAAIDALDTPDVAQVASKLREYADMRATPDDLSKTLFRAADTIDELVTTAKSLFLDDANAIVGAQGLDIVVRFPIAAFSLLRRAVEKAEGG